MQYEDFVKAYKIKSDEELLRLQLDPRQLTPEATTALTSELTKRGIGADRLNAFRDHEARRKERQARDPGNLFLYFRFGIGRWYFGKADRTFDPETGVERFRTTVFVLLLWLPLIPTGSYIIQKKRGFRSGKIAILKRLPLDWIQVLKVWAVAACCLFILLWILKRM